MKSTIYSVKRDIDILSQYRWNIQKKRTFKLSHQYKNRINMAMKKNLSYLSAVVCDSWPQEHTPLKMARYPVTPPPWSGCNSNSLRGLE